MDEPSRRADPGELIEVLNASPRSAIAVNAQDAGGAHRRARRAGAARAYPACGRSGRRSPCRGEGAAPYARWRADFDAVLVRRDRRLCAEA